MLDEFRVSAPAGFPDHPHRGFETVTYMISGSTEHEDFTGRHGVINPGDLQWMTAGRGIVHCEMPGKNTGESHGLQLWVNLSKKYKNPISISPNIVYEPNSLLLSIMPKSWSTYVNNAIYKINMNKTCFESDEAHGWPRFM